MVDAIIFYPWMMLVLTLASACKTYHISLAFYYFVFEFYWPPTSKTLNFLAAWSWNTSLGLVLLDLTSHESNMLT